MKTTSESLVRLSVPAAMKGRWVRLSRADGMKLNDWVVSAVEEQIKQRLTRIVIPEHLKFSDLKLAQDSDGHLSVDADVIEQICRVNNLPAALFFDAPEDYLANLINHWYVAHLQNGGERDPVCDALFAEVLAEERAGQHISHSPGKA